MDELIPAERRQDKPGSLCIQTAIALPTISFRAPHPILTVGAVVPVISHHEIMTSGNHPCRARPTLPDRVNILSGMMHFSKRFTVGLSG